MSTCLDAPFDEIVRHTDGPCVSLLFPLDLRHPDEPRDLLMLRDLVDAARARLVELAVPDVTGTVDGASLRRRAVGEGATGVAVYRAAGWGAEIFVRRPVGPVVAVGDRCHVLPLVPAMIERWTGHVLTVGAGSVALYRWVDGDLGRIAVDGLPPDVDQALWYERHERHAGAHAGGPAGTGGGSIVHHGAGGEEDDRKARLDRYLHQVDDLVVGTIGRAGTLVVVGTSANVARYEHLSHHPSTVGLPLGSPAELSGAELRAGVGEVAQADRARAAERSVARYASLAGTGLTAADPDELAAAAAGGRVEALLVGSTLAGPTGRDVVVHRVWQDADRELANRALVDACRTGAAVEYVDQTHQAGVPALAGILRY